MILSGIELATFRSFGITINDTIDYACSESNGHLAKQGILRITVVLDFVHRTVF
jgi:hypothetical protein